MTDDELRLSGAYSLDAVDATERAAHEELMRRDPVVDAETREFRETATELSHLVSAPPPDRLRADVLSAVSATRPLPPSIDDQSSELPAGRSPARTRRWADRRTAVIAALIAAAAVVGVVVW